MVKGLWWKILGAVLVLYSLVFGLGIPLNSGITDVQPRQMMEGDTIELHFNTYNTDYTQLKDISLAKAWLRVDDVQIIAAEDIKLNGPASATALFTIPDLSFEGQEVLAASLFVSDPRHGYAILPSAVFIRSDDKSANIDTNRFDDLAGIHKSDDVHFPFRNILLETIRNTYYHVPLWFAMVLLFAFAAYYSWQYLRTKNISADKKAAAFSEVGLLFGILGFFTGAVWAKYTWGAFWSWDIKQFTAAVAMLIYLAYFVLRSSVPDHDKRARFTASFNIFAFIMLIPLIFIVPRMTDSLHPGSGGNPAMGGEDLDSTMRLIFYPAVIGWILIGIWISDVRSRINRLSYKLEDVI